VEELLLRRVLAGEELDVVDQQRVHGTEAALEVVHVLLLQRLHHAADELLRTKVEHLRAGIVLHEHVAGGVHEVGLAEAGAPIEQQGVVRPARVHRHLHGRGLAQLVRLAFDEGFEGVVRVEVVHVRWLVRRLRHARCRLGRRGRHGRRRASRHRAGAGRADLQANGQGAAAQVFDDRLDLVQVLLAHGVQRIGVRRVEEQPVSVLPGLQRHQPGMDVLGRQLAFKTLETAPPEITHQVFLPQLRARARGVDDEVYQCSAPASGSGHRKAGMWSFAQAVDSPTECHAYFRAFFPLHPDVAP